MGNNFSKLESALKPFKHTDGRITLLTGAGISAESGIPTFRGPEGYWTIGSREYRPEEMATYAMFSFDPWEVWAWYLYRRTVCRQAEPNKGHLAIAAMERIFEKRFRLITQNVDGLHLRAGSSEERTFQIHGNIDYIRCDANCSQQLFSFPPAIGPKSKNEPVTEKEKELLICPRCQGPARPHVLWFDECYDELLFRAQSALQWAEKTNLLLVVGTAGATSLPMRIGGIVSRNPRALLIDVNPNSNPFRTLAENHQGGIVLAGNSAELLPKVLSILEAE